METNNDIFKTIGYGRELSILSESNNFLDPYSYIEVSRPVKRRNQTSGTPSYKSYKCTLKKIDAYLIEFFKLYTNLESIFNSAEHLNDTFFNHKTAGGQDGYTTFALNPRIHDENNKTSFDSLESNNLISKASLDDYFDKNGICVGTLTESSKYVYYSSEAKMWVEDLSSQPKVMSETLDGIWTSKSKLKFNYGSTLYIYTDEVEAPKNILLDVTGNILLDKSYEETWYELQNYFVGITINDKLVTMAFLKNILKIKNDNNDELIIAQFHFHCPIGAKTKFRIVTNAKCKLFGRTDKTEFVRKLYDSVNAVNLSFYNSWTH